MLIHDVLFRYEEGYLTETAFHQIAAAFRSLREALPDEVLEVSVYRNTIERDTNMDLMVVMKLASEQSLPIYLNHPIHTALVKETLPHIIQRCSFDHPA